MTVIVKLQGGLGNQMFQYAAGRSLSLYKNTSLLLDLSFFERCDFRTYDLNPFKIQEYIATVSDIETLLGNQRNRILRKINKLRWIFSHYSKRPFFLESQIRPFDKNIFNTPHHVYLDGYWQSEKYFIGISDIIRKEFSLRYPISQKNLQYAEKINSSMAVAIHVRRGDYVSNSHTLSVHGVSSVNYYKKAISLIRDQIANPEFFVFSDDIAWCKLNLPKLESCSFIEGNSVYQSQEELHLMQLCKHHIIANSTFSWWGAWLSSGDGITIAPANWFRSLKVNLQDLLPNSWLRI